MDYFPLFIDLRGRKVLVVGGGAVAARKVALLLAAGAHVEVVAPALGEGIADLVGSGVVTHAGRVFEPARRTAMHHRHLEAGARMMPAGLWYRPAFYGRKEDREQAIREEALAVRRNVGLIDVSTLGGLDVRGPDAAEFLNRMYTFNYAKQPVGRSRYVLMTDQTGAIIDDGVACRFHAEHFYVTATTSGVDGVYRLMLQWNAQWRLDVDIANVTAAFAGVNIAGPKAREVLQKLSDDPIDKESFPYLRHRRITVGGVPCIAMRLGFVGELAYELHHPSSRSLELWDKIMDAGREFGIRPFGVEAQRLLRLEKGHIIVSQDTDFETTPWKVGMEWAVKMDKPDFVGKSSLARSQKREQRDKLVPWTMEPGLACPPEGMTIKIGGEVVGRVTSSRMSPVLGYSLGLGWVTSEHAAEGTRVTIGGVPATVAGGHAFYDPEGGKLRA